MPGTEERYRDTRERLARRKGFNSDRDYQEHLAKARGFTSRKEYRREMAKRRQTKPENQALSDLIHERLQELGKNQAWLALQIGRSRQSVSLYGQGKALPKHGDTFRRIYSVLGLRRLTNA